jgi:hypothetical protein
MQDLEQAIRERAYHLWIEDDCREGAADAHWLAAQREILSASLSTFARITTEQPKSSKANRGAANSRKKRRAA